MHIPLLAMNIGQRLDMASVIKGLFIIICTSCVDLMNSQLHLSQLVSRHALLSQYLPVVVIQLLDGKCRTR